MSENYDDIINLPRHVSKTRPAMPKIDRAAQFAPFAALTGHEEAVKEAARLTQKRPQLDEQMQEIINKKLKIIADRLADCPEVTISYFKADEKKSGGEYLRKLGIIERIDEHERLLVMKDGQKILFDDILNVSGQIFSAFF